MNENSNASMTEDFDTDAGRGTGARYANWGPPGVTPVTTDYYWNRNTEAQPGATPVNVKYNQYWPR